ncbi:CRISPR-associated protein Cas7 [Porphyromonas gingivalis]|uniref:CRISPR-associated protein Cas7 n=1 Tax=Porphyromonas gingivalis TaxID=837 RepID=UPI0032631BED
MKKKMQPVLYLRGLKNVSYSVFAVDKGQKFYRDPLFSSHTHIGKKLPFSSGQQVKRCIIDALLSNLNVERAPVTFVFEQKNLKEGEVLSLCDPNYPDQLLGGWMLANSKKEKTKKKEKEIKDEDSDENSDGSIKKRRSPLSISALTPLHPLLAEYNTENISFDRSDNKSLHRVIIRDDKGNLLSEEETKMILEGTHRDLYRKWIQDSGRATGLFVYDVAIDLRTLFSVSIYDVPNNIKLDEKKWKRGKNAFGECWTLCKSDREKLIPALAHALVNWRITSNQARTFSLMETLAIAIGDNANAQAGAIRARLIDDESGKPKATFVLDENAGANLYITPPCAAHILLNNEDVEALRKAEKHLIEVMLAFDYDNQF